MKKLCCLILILVFSAGCTQQKASTEEDGALEIDWLVPLHTPQPPKEKALDIIEDKTNTKLKLIWVPDSTKEERINTTLASGSMPKVMTMPDLEDSAVVSALRSGMFWEIGPYLKDYPNLRKLDKTILKNISVDGKVYGIYRERPMARQGVVIRKDWLDNLGLEMPETVDDLYKIAKAFTEQDPDQNGKDDTIGLSDRNDLTFGAFKTLASYFGAPNEWGTDEDGNLFPYFKHEAYKDAMVYLKKFYEEGLMNRDFAVTSKTQQQDLVIQGKAGIYIGALSDAMNLRDQGLALNPGFQLDIANRIKGPDGKERTWALGGHGGMFAISKSSVKTEEEVKKILAFFDRIAEEDLNNLMLYGIEGVHYEKKGESGYFRKQENYHLWEAEIQPLNQLIGVNKQALKSAEDPLRAKNEKLEEDNRAIAVQNPAEPLYSATQMDRGTELKKIMDDATFKFILGEINENSFDQAVVKWEKHGGGKIMKELNEDLKKAN
ncbi:extracellular solute-binding protein [Bacillus haynesii]|uniref:extracellular solute-binding protein n=1 Tax=Bacillus haynesii TaxID=1925021 RepID=UPI002280E95C|nr:extracellular solute-binding protein [Bacillus haynesii]MCY7772407.1 extracellular solute-binding protein [Bacillus haynesii]MCY9217230.1 extracellular solute-binding protein [Bacillus haynesii]MEC0783507.1 extracellular solute-binding protein [Bacillus haynesii]